MAAILLTLFFSVSFSHICLLAPTQRGGADIHQPGTGSCFKKTGPCGGLASQPPAYTLVAGKVNTLEIQQNLNHYSIGERGWIDVGISYLPDPQSDSDFQLIYELADYEAFHQWTQTNLTLNVNIPSTTSLHAVIRVRYVPRKPTEPTFYQCADVIVTSLVGEEDQHQHVTSKPLPHRKPVTATSAAGAPLIGLAPNGAETEIWAVNPFSGANVLLNTIGVPIGSFANPTASSGVGYIADEVVTVNRNNNHVYFLKASTFEGYSNTLIEINGNDGTVLNAYNILSNIQFSGIHYNFNYTGIVVAFGLVSDSTGWHVSAGSFSLGTLTPEYHENFRTVEDVSPFVDFTWSDFDQSTATLYVLMRHEDDPISLPAQLFIFSFQAPGYKIINLSQTYIFSSFIVDSRKSNLLLAMSPGPVDSSGNVNNPKWQAIQIDTLTGAITPYVSAPVGVNNYPIFWGGGVRGFSNSRYSNSPDSTTVHFLSTSGPGYPHPPMLLGLAFNVTAGTITPLKTVPFFYNMVLVG